MMHAKTALLTVQRWGNSLAVRIPAAMAHRAHFQLGTPVEMTLQECGVVIKTIDDEHLTLDEKLALFDAKKHRGEVMMSGRLGMEKF